VTYPDFKVVYDLDDSDYQSGNRGEVIVWDTMGSSDEDDWVRVFDPSHKFVGDCVVENGLIRIRIYDSELCGFKLYFWNGSSWSLELKEVRFTLGTTVLKYPFFKELKSISTDEVKLKVKFADSSVDDVDYFAEVEVTLKRGQYSCELKVTNVFPIRNWQFGYFEVGPLGAYRFGYAGDDEVGDNDLSVHARNSVMSDNFALIFDPDQHDVVVCCFAAEKPSTAKHVYSGRAIRFYPYSSSDLPMRGYSSIVSYCRVSDLFMEAEA